MSVLAEWYSSGGGYYRKFFGSLLACEAEFRPPPSSSYRVRTIHRRATAQPGSAAECFLTFLKRERARLWLFWQGGGGIIGDERRRVKGAAAGFSSLESVGGGGGK